jgi:hypothetical protein
MGISPRLSIAQIKYCTIETKSRIYRSDNNSITIDPLARSTSVSWLLPGRHRGTDLRKLGDEKPPDARNHQRLPELPPRDRWPKAAPFLQCQPPMTVAALRRTPSR